MQAALEASVPLSTTGDEGPGIVDARADLEKLVMLRHDLRCIARIAGELSADQRLILACQLLPLGPAETCMRLGWSSEKYRKVAQRARARLRVLVEREEGGGHLEESARG